MPKTTPAARIERALTDASPILYRDPMLPGYAVDHSFLVLSCEGCGTVLPVAKQAIFIQWTRARRSAL